MDLRSFEIFVGLNGNALKSIQRFKARKMRKYGLTSAHTNCLCHLLLAEEGGLTQSELVQQEMLDPSQISRVLRELIGKGYVAIDGEEGKYRRKYLLTHEGRRIALEIGEIIKEICRYVSRDIPEQELDAFHETFRKICDELRSAEAIFMNGQAQD